MQKWSLDTLHVLIGTNDVQDVPEITVCVKVIDLLVTKDIALYYAWLFSKADKVI